MEEISNADILEPDVNKWLETQVTVTYDKAKAEPERLLTGDAAWSKVQTLIDESNKSAA